MDYEKFKQDMEQDVLKNLANRGIEAETDVQHIDKLNDGYDALTVKAPGSVIGVNINLSSAFAVHGKMILPSVNRYVIIELNSSSFSLIARFISAKEKNCSSRSAAMIQVDIFPTIPSAFGLSLGVRTRAGMIATP